MASTRIRGITIEIGGDTSKLVSALKSADTAIRTTQSDLNTINRALKFDTTNVELLKDKQIALNDKVAESRDKLEAEKAMLEELKNSDGFDENSEQAKRLKTQIDADTVALKQAEQAVKEFGSVGAQQMQALGAKITAVGTKITAVGDSMIQMGNTLMTRVTVPIVTAFGASVKSAIDWETAFTGVKKTVDETAEGYEQLSDNIMEMARTTASSKEEIAGVMEAAGQLGVSGVENLTEFTKTMVMLGDTTNLTAEDAATALARFMNITGESQSNVDKIGSAIVDLGNNFATTESEIVEMSTRLASAGTIAGLSSTDILALATAMSSVGIQAEAGGTAMSQTLKSIATEVANFKDGETEGLETIASVAGVSAQEFADAWTGDPVQAIQQFVKGLANVKDEGKNVFAVLGEMGMTGIRQTNMLQSLALASDMLTDAVNTSNTAYEENTALQAEAEKRYETLAAKLSQLKETITEVAITIGNILTPYIEKVMAIIDQVAQKFLSLDEATQETIVKIAAIVAAIAPALLIGGTVVKVVGLIVQGVGGIITTIGTLMPILSTVGATITGTILPAIATINAPVLAIIAVIGALTAVIIYLWNTSESFRAVVLDVVESIKTNVLEFITGLQPIFEGVIALLIALKDMVVAIVTELIDRVKIGLEGQKDTINAIMLIIKVIIETVLVTIKAVVNNALDTIRNLVQLALDLITGIVQVATALIKGDWESALNAVKETANNILNDVINLFSDWGNNIGEFFSDLIGRFGDWGRDMIDSLVDGIKSKISAVTDAISGVASTIASYIHFSEPDKGALSNFHTYMPDMISSMVNGINNGIPQLENAMANMAKSLVPTNLLDGVGGATTNTVNLTVYGAQGQDVNELADIIQDRINSNVYRNGAVFA